MLLEELVYEAQRSMVSIAGAILWGVLPIVAAEALGYLKVSIAGAILWGVLRPVSAASAAGKQFQSQGRFFGGCCAVEEGEV